jgi:hypothetical protein
MIRAVESKVPAPLNLGLFGFLFEAFVLTLLLPLIEIKSIPEKRTMMPPPIRSAAHYGNSLIIAPLIESKRVNQEMLCYNKTSKLSDASLCLSLRSLCTCPTVHNSNNISRNSFYLISFVYLSICFRVQAPSLSCSSQVLLGLPIPAHRK